MTTRTCFSWWVAVGGSIGRKHSIRIFGLPLPLLGTADELHQDFLVLPGKLPGPAARAPERHTVSSVSTMASTDRTDAVQKDFVFHIFYLAKVYLISKTYSALVGRGRRRAGALARLPLPDAAARRKIYIRSIYISASGFLQTQKRVFANILQICKNEILRISQLQKCVSANFRKMRFMFLRLPSSRFCRRRCRILRVPSAFAGPCPRRRPCTLPNSSMSPHRQNCTLQTRSQ